ERLPPVAPPAPEPRPRRETARVVLRSGATWRPLALALLAVLLLVAGGVHLFVVPLEVLAVWRKPATLAIATEPAGATAKLDGAALAAPTPTEVTVRRDRYDHLLEVAAPGYRPARRTIRYDGAVALATTVRLEKEAPSLEPLPAKAAAPVPAAERAPVRGAVAPTEAAPPAAKAAPNKAGKAGAHAGKPAARKRAAKKR
ncbi:MAG TPA: PEGA domain-containing protein, partial [Polyangia bacterium]|nr:PEGA domain-containing protein [Polyangia bacterium]